VKSKRDDECEPSIHRPEHSSFFFSHNLPDNFIICVSLNRNNRCEAKIGCSASPHLFAACAEPGHSRDPAQAAGQGQGARGDKPHGRLQLGHGLRAQSAQEAQALGALAHQSEGDERAARGRQVQPDR
jgi:hypothetical protein